MTRFRILCEHSKDRRQDMGKPVKMYTLSTCSHCKAAKKFMSDHGVVHQCTDVDLLSGEARKAMIEEVKKYNPSCSFPTILIGERVIVGFNEKAIREALGI
jgi:glutaredoxin-like protein NrdH